MLVVARAPHAANLTRGELVASLALATDVAMGHPVEQGLGASILATRLAELAGLTAAERARTTDLALLRHIGCTTENDSLAALAGDEIRLAARLAPLSGSKSSDYIRAIARLATEGRSPFDAALTLARVANGMRQFDAVNRAICEVAQSLAGRLGFGPEHVTEIAAVYERWDGSGFPFHLRAEAIPVTIRVSQVADLATALHDLGHEDPARVVRERAGSGFDPAIAAVFDRHARELLAELDVESRWAAVDRLQIARMVLDDDALDDALHAVADFTDLKSPYLVGHSSGVATLAEGATAQLNLPAADARDVRLAGLVHDLGRVSVSAAVWGKEGPLTAGEWEAVRLHVYQTERLLARAPYLARLGAIAAMHHERLDGSGYVRGAVSERQTPAARVLAAADLYHALTEPRPHRPARTPTDAAGELQREVSAGRIDRDAGYAVLAAAGQRTPRRRRYAADLTAREVEVLRLLARGRSNRDIGRVLSISPRTAENHTRAIYNKAGVTTRAAATLFAMQHGLVAVGLEEDAEP
jgi:HD-GYP domain-containing protein (c-di-GMP phosphodiesterase class II)